MRTARGTFVALVSGLALAAFDTQPAQAVEAAAGFYLLGSKGSMAGFTPPPGTYLSDLKYYYSAKLDLAVFGGLLVTEVDAEAYFEIPTVLWVAPHKVLGGNVGFGLVVPFGWKDARAAAELDLPPPFSRTLRASIEDEDAAFGDPVPTALIGWHSGNWHWNVQALLNVPIGFWQKGNLTNIGFNRWGLDTTAAVTWLDPKLGLEISAAAGVTFNFEKNPETDYRSGDEFHLEYAVVQNFSKQFGIGITGYYYRQITADSGSGARLGAFKGEVTGIGPLVNYNFELRQIPISTSLRWIHEFDVKNRLEGDAGLLTVTMPLSVLSQ